MNDPAYYRDLLNKILLEDEADDVPLPPGRKEIKTQQILRILHSKNPNLAILKNILNVDDGIGPGDFLVNIELSGREDLSTAFLITDNKVDFSHNYAIRLVNPETDFEDEDDEADWNNYIQQEFHYELTRAVKQDYHVGAKFHFNKWEDWPTSFIVNSDDFTNFLNRECEYWAQLLTGNDPAVVKNVVWEYIKGKKTNG